MSLDPRPAVRVMLTALAAGALGFGSFSLMTVHEQLGLIAIGSAMTGALAVGPLKKDPWKRTLVLPA